MKPAQVLLFSRGCVTHLYCWGVFQQCEVLTSLQLCYFDLAVADFLIKKIIYRQWLVW